MHRGHVVNSLHSIYWDCVLLVLLHWYFNYRFSYDDEDIFAVTLTSEPSSNGHSILKGRAM